ncbi:hypothetical protein H5410_046257 [Solanum commersonii]|uniref:Uncharacterized protein n=1 Tax=Solanum commersonii TaxID=4109 RepID=A0A9J5XDY4_SOLCO|nr:hypothetical protein H5410_046257 [Solanum commersonii]
MDSTSPIERSTIAILDGLAWKSPNGRIQLRSTSDEVNVNLPIGVCFPGQGDHDTEISKQFDVGIAGEQLQVTTPELRSP